MLVGAAGVGSGIRGMEGFSEIVGMARLKHHQGRCRAIRAWLGDPLWRNRGLAASGPFGMYWHAGREKGRCTLYDTV